MKLAAPTKGAAQVAAVPPFHIYSNTAFERSYLLLSDSLTTRKPYPTQGQTAPSPKSKCASFPYELPKAVPGFINNFVILPFSYSECHGDQQHMFYYFVSKCKMNVSKSILFSLAALYQNHKNQQRWDWFI